MKAARGELERAVERVVAVMRTRLGEVITADELAAAALFSKSHFTRTFRRETGFTPTGYLAHLRVNEAKELLRETDARIIDVANQVGYQSSGAFWAMFRQLVGVSPSVYRKQQRAEDNLA